MTAWHEDRDKVRFLSRIDIQDDGCWLWTGPGQQYGRFSIGSDPERWAHRNAWRLHHRREIPEGMQLHHLCGVPRCVNPLHLELVTREDHHQRHPARTDRPHGWLKRQTEGCSCETCVTGDRAYRRAKRLELQEKAANGERTIPHGTHGYNTFGCRCAECKAAKRQARKRPNAEQVAS